MLLTWFERRGGSIEDQVSKIVEPGVVRGDTTIEQAVHGL